METGMKLLNLEGKAAASVIIWAAEDKAFFGKEYANHEGYIFT